MPVGSLPSSTGVASANCVTVQSPAAAVQVAAMDLDGTVLDRQGLPIADHREGVNKGWTQILKKIKEEAEK